MSDCIIKCCAIPGYPKYKRPEPDCPEPQVTCNYSLNIYNRNSDGSERFLPPYSSTNAPEHFCVPRIPEYNIGNGDFSFEFWFDPAILPSINGYTDNRIVFKWESSYKPMANPPNNDPIDNQTEISLFLLPNNRLQFQFSLIYPHIGPPFPIEPKISSIRSNGYLLPNNIYHIVIVKTTNNASNWKMYINGQDLTTLYSNMLPIGADNLDNASGDLCFGVEWNSTSTNQSYNTIYGPNTGHMVLSNLRFYNRILLLDEAKANLDAGCFSAPTNTNNLLMYYPLNDTNGDIVSSALTGNLNNPGRLENYAASRLILDSENAAWDKICCGEDIYIPPPAPPPPPPPQPGCCPANLDRITQFPLVPMDMGQGELEWFLEFAVTVTPNQLCIAFNDIAIYYTITYIIGANGTPVENTTQFPVIVLPGMGGVFSITLNSLVIFNTIGIDVADPNVYFTINVYAVGTCIDNSTSVSLEIVPIKEPPKYICCPLSLSITNGNFNNGIYSIDCDLINGDYPINLSITQTNASSNICENYTLVSISKRYKLSSDANYSEWEVISGTELDKWNAIIVPSNNINQPTYIDLFLNQSITANTDVQYSLQYQCNNGTVIQTPFLQAFIKVCEEVQECCNISISYTGPDKLVLDRNNGYWEIPYICSSACGNWKGVIEFDVTVKIDGGIEEPVIFTNSIIANIDGETGGFNRSGTIRALASQPPLNNISIQNSSTERLEFFIHATATCQNDEIKNNNFNKNGSGTPPPPCCPASITNIGSGIGVTSPANGAIPTTHPSYINPMGNNLDVEISLVLQIHFPDADNLNCLDISSLELEVEYNGKKTRLIKNNSPAPMQGGNYVYINSASLLTNLNNSSYEFINFREYWSELAPKLGIDVNDINTFRLPSEPMFTFRLITNGNEDCKSEYPYQLNIKCCESQIQATDMSVSLDDNTNIFFGFVLTMDATIPGLCYPYIFDKSSYTNQEILNMTYITVQDYNIFDLPLNTLLNSAITANVHSPTDLTKIYNITNWNIAGHINKDALEPLLINNGYIPGTNFNIKVNFNPKTHVKNYCGYNLDGVDYSKTAVINPKPCCKPEFTIIGQGAMNTKVELVYRPNNYLHVNNPTINNGYDLKFTFTGVVTRDKDCALYDKLLVDIRWGQVTLSNIDITELNNTVGLWYNVPNPAELSKINDNSIKTDTYELIIYASSFAQYFNDPTLSPSFDDLGLTNPFMVSTKYSCKNEPDIKYVIQETQKNTILKCCPISNQFTINSNYNSNSNPNLCGDYIISINKNIVGGCIPPSLLYPTNQNLFRNSFYLKLSYVYVNNNTATQNQTPYIVYLNQFPNAVVTFTGLNFDTVDFSNFSVNICIPTTDLIQYVKSNKVILAAHFDTWGDFSGALETLSFLDFTGRYGLDLLGYDSMINPIADEYIYPFIFQNLNGCGVTYESTTNYASISVPNEICCQLQIKNTYPTGSTNTMQGVEVLSNPNYNNPITPLNKRDVKIEWDFDLAIVGTKDTCLDITNLKLEITYDGYSTFSIENNNMGSEPGAPTYYIHLNDPAVLQNLNNGQTVRIKFKEWWSSLKTALGYPNDLSVKDITFKFIANNIDMSCIIEKSTTIKTGLACCPPTKLTGGFTSPVDTIPIQYGLKFNNLPVNNAYNCSPYMFNKNSYTILELQNMVHIKILPNMPVNGMSLILDIQLSAIAGSSVHNDTYLTQPSNLLELYNNSIGWQIKAIVSKTGLIPYLSGNGYISNTPFDIEMYLKVDDQARNFSCPVDLLSTIYSGVKVIIP